MEFNYFDIVASAIILLLGLKGIINGFFKEVFGLIGIVGGIFVASRLGDEVGLALSDLIFKFENTSAISFTGFLATLAVFWFLMILLGFIFKKFSHISGLGPVDRIFGFVFGASKFFLITAVIAHAAYNIKAIKTTVDSNMQNSFLFPILVETGSIIMKLDPVDISDDINATVNSMQEKVTKTIADEAKEQLQQNASAIEKSIDKKESN